MSLTKKRKGTKKMMVKMNKLETCPECNSRLNENENIQYCENCGYWTRKGTARVDSIAIFA
jgi:ribosomal protein L37AE/L43A